VIVVEQIAIFCRFFYYRDPISPKNVPKKPPNASEWLRITSRTISWLVRSPYLCSVEQNEMGLTALFDMLGKQTARKAVREQSFIYHLKGRMQGCDVK